MTTVKLTRGADSSERLNPEIAEHHQKHSFSIARVLVSAAVATVAAVLFVAIGMPVAGATAVGAAVGGGTVAVLTVRHALD